MSDSFIEIPSDFQSVRNKMRSLSLHIPLKICDFRALYYIYALVRTASVFLASGTGQIQVTFNNIKELRRMRSVFFLSPC